MKRATICLILLIVTVTVMTGCASRSKRHMDYCIELADKKGASTRTALQNFLLSCMKSKGHQDITPEQVEEIRNKI